MLPLAASGTTLQQSYGQGQEAVRRLTRDHAVHGTTLLVWAVDRLGWDEGTRQPNVCVWHPETVRLELERHDGVAMPDHNFDKLMACVAILIDDAFFKDAGRFIILTNALAGNGFDPTQVDHPSSLEIAWAITEALLLVPPEHADPEPFAAEVRHYVGQVLRAEGYLRPPDILRIALDADFSAQVTYDFSGEHELLASLHKHQEDRAREVTAVISEGLEDLLSQLKALPLQTGSVTEMEQRIGHTLRSRTHVEG